MRPSSLVRSECSLVVRSVEEPPEGLIVVEGEMTEERRERIQQAMVNDWRRMNSAETMNGK